MTEPASRNRVWRDPVSVIMMFAVFMGATDLTVVATLLPRMITDLGVNTADIDRYIWVVNAYLIAYVVSIPLFGRLGDVIGIRKALMAATVIFAAGSWWCATGQSLQDVIVGRAIQGFGAGALLPLALAAAAAFFEDGARRAAAIGAIGATDEIGWVTGPIYGALVVNQAHFIDDAWRLVFWLNIPVAMLLIFVAIWRFDDHEARDHTRPRGIVRALDLPGFLLLSLFLVTLNLALASGGEIGATAGRGLRAFGGTPNTLANYIPQLLAIAVVALVLFVIRFRAEDEPFLPKRLFRYRAFKASLWTNFLLGTVLMTGMVNVPVLVALLETQADTATRSAVVLAPFTATIAVFSLLSARLMRHWSSRRVTQLGLILALAGNLAVYPLLEYASYVWITVGLAIAGTGIGLALTPLSTTALEATTARDRGAAASSLLVVRLLGMTIGISILTALGVQRLQVLTGRLEPVVRDANESTAEFLLRQQEYIIEKGLPLGVQVVQETFLAAAALTLLALIPARYLSRRGSSPDQSPESV